LNELLLYVLSARRQRTTDLTRHSKRSDLWLHADATYAATITRHVKVSSEAPYTHALAEVLESRRILWRMVEHAPNCMFLDRLQADEIDPIGNFNVWILAWNVSDIAEVAHYCHEYCVLLFQNPRRTKKS
jgi:hypothetical protein